MSPERVPGLARFHLLGTLLTHIDLCICAIGARNTDAHGKMVHAAGCECETNVHIFDTLVHGYVHLAMIPFAQFGHENIPPGPSPDQSVSRSLSPLLRGAEIKGK
jgi:hypothetical protein